MAKRTKEKKDLPESLDVESEEMPDETPQPTRKFHRLKPPRPKWTLAMGGIFVVLLIVAYFVPPLPLGWQLLAALFDSLLAGLVVHFAFAEYGRRVKRIKFPRIAGKKIHPQEPGTLGGWAMAVLVFVWWMTPWAPIRVDYITAAELLAEFTDEVTQATLIQPHEHLAVLQRPIPPRSALDAAKKIPDDADAFRLALREMALGRFARAREHLAGATPQGDVTAGMISMAGPLIELYDGKYQAAAQGFEKALESEPKDFLLACQTVAALTHAGMFSKAEQLAEKLRSRAAEGPEQDTAINLLAAISISQGKLKEARALWADEDQEATKAAGALNNQGLLNANLANYDVAELKYQSAISAWRGRWDKTRWKDVDVEIHVGAGVLNRGVGFYGVGKFKDAENQLQRARAKLNNLPNNHSAKGVAAAALAMLYFEEGRFTEVEPLIDQASRLFDKNTETHTLATRYLSARLTAARGRYTHALRGFRSLLSEVSIRLSPDHPFTADVKHQMAVVLLLQVEDDAAAAPAKLKAAAAFCDQAINIIDGYSKSQSLPQGHWTAHRVRTTLGRIHFRQKKTRAAAEDFKLAGNQLRAAFREKHQAAAKVKHPAIADVLAAQAETQARSKGKFDFNNAVNMYIDVLGDDGKAHPRVARWRYQLAKIELAAGDLQEAKATLEDVMQIQEEKQPRHPHYADSLRLHAQVLRKIDPNDPAAAEAEQRAVEVTEKHTADEAEPGN